MALFKKQIKLVLLIAISCLAINVDTATAQDREYVIKAVFLYNFFNYIQWPDKNVAKGDKPVVNLCIYGDDPFGEALSVIQKKMTRKTELNIVRFKNGERIDKASCHILFVSESEQHNLDFLQRKFTNRGVLTVSDINGFARSGGIIELAKRKNKIKLVINKDRLKECGFNANSQILAIADIVP